MSEYTPNDDIVRNNYASSRSMSDIGIPSLDAFDEFDRWLAAHDAEWEEVAWRFSCLLDELTDGRMSKTGYELSVMVSEIEDTFRKNVKEELADLVEDGYQAVRDSGVLTGDASVNARIWQAVEAFKQAVLEES